MPSMEAIRDEIGRSLRGGSGISVAVNDPANSITISSDVRAKYHDDVSQKSNGNLTVTDSGHLWIATGQITPRINGGKIGYPQGQVVPPTGATYALVEADGPVSVISGDIKWDSSPDTGSTVAIGAFTTSGVNTSSEMGVGTGSCAHLTVTPTYMQFAVFNNVQTDYTVLTPVGGTSDSVYFAQPHRTDGATRYPCEIVLDRTNGRAYVTVGDHPTVEFADPRISLACRYPFWESYPGSGANGNLGGFVNPSAAEYVSADALAARRGAARPRNGASAVYARPSALSRGGATWWDSTSSRATVSDGASWRDTATGALTGNLIPSAAQTARLDVSGVITINASKARVVLPSAPGWKASTGYQVTATAPGNIVAYTADTIPAVAGQTYSVGFDRLIATGTGRGTYIELRWFDNASAQIGAGILSTTFVPSTSTVMSSPIITATAPANTARIMMLVISVEAAAGDGLRFTRLFAGQGTLTGHIN